MFNYILSETIKQSVCHKKVRKEIFLALRRIKREEKQSGCNEGITSVIATAERTGNLLFKCSMAVPCHHSGRFGPKPKNDGR
jgi:hypothetical protein